MIANLILAMLASAAVALVGALASKALGIHHFWPGVIVAFVVFTPVWFRIFWRWSA